MQDLSYYARTRSALGNLCCHSIFNSIALAPLYTCIFFALSISPSQSLLSLLSLLSLFEALLPSLFETLFPSLFETLFPSLFETLFNLSFLFLSLFPSLSFPLYLPFSFYVLFAIWFDSVFSKFKNFSAIKITARFESR